MSPRNRQGFASLLVSFALLCGVRSQSQNRRNANSELNIQEIIRSLPPDSKLRIQLEDGRRGDGFRYPWMDSMRGQGIKRALIVLEFVWDGHPKNMRVDRVVYYNKYDTDCAQIADARQLEDIQASGLERQLADFAISQTASSRWLTVDDDRPKKMGTAAIYLYDDELLPHPPVLIGHADPELHLRYPNGFFEDETAVAEFAKSRGVSQAQLDDALMYAASSSDDSCVIRTLASAGANVNMRGEGKEWSTPLIVAIESGAVNNVRAFLDAGANPNARNSDGKTALSVAEETVNHRYREVIRLLKERGAKY